MKRYSILVSVFALFYSNFSWSSEKAKGEFIALQACDAYASFVKATNPSMVKTIPGRSYEVLEVNKKDNFSWVRLLVDDAEPSERWVSVECGKISNFSIVQSPKDNPLCKTADLFDSYVLALTWQPGFCEHPSQDKDECKAMAEGELVVSNLTLHGLWPNKKDCDIGYGNCSGADMSLSEETLSKIKPWMPSFYYSQSFGNYEWLKHGTCQTKFDDDLYFLTAISLVALFDESPLGKLIRESAGGSVTKENLLNAAIGADSSIKNKIKFFCKDNYLVEIRVSLNSNLDSVKKIGEVLDGAPGFIDGVQKGECKGSVIHIEKSGL
jgi:ribonuclease T2